MDKKQLDAIATRGAHCKPFGAAVTLSVGERDALVALAKSAASYQEVLHEVSEYLTCVIDGSMSRNNASALASELQAQIDAAMAKEQA